MQITLKPLAERAWDILEASGYGARWGQHSDRDTFLQAWGQKSILDAKMVVDNDACIMSSRVSDDTWLIHNLARDRAMARGPGHRAAVRVACTVAECLVYARAQQFRIYHSPNSPATRWMMEDFAAKSPPGLTMRQTNIFRAVTLPLFKQKVPVSSPMGLDLDLEDAEGGITLKLQGVPYVMAETWLGAPGENLFGLTDLVRIENVSVEWSRAALLTQAARRYGRAVRSSFLVDDAWLRPEAAAAYGLTHVSAATLATGTADTLVALVDHLRELERAA
jgi:hypothetical protein